MKGVQKEQSKVPAESAAYEEVPLRWRFEHQSDHLLPSPITSKQFCSQHLKTFTLSSSFVTDSADGQSNCHWLRFWRGAPSTLYRKLTTQFKALRKTRWPDWPPPPQLVLPDAALRCIDPDSVVQAECEWMNGSALLTCPDLCNCVWPSASPQSHLKFVNMNNLCVYFPFPAFPRERGISQTMQTKSHQVPQGYCIV